MGQHFLRDRQVAEDIVACLPSSPARVVEIGPGEGALTRPLLGRFDRVRAVELDPRLARDLAPRLGRPPGLEVVAGDAVEVDLDDLGRDGPWSVAGNLPYSVGSPILRRVLPRADLFPAVVAMVQREVAERLVAGPARAARGLLSLEVEAHGRAELMFEVPPGCFFPPPRVTSAVVRIDLVPSPVVPERLERALQLASAAFLHRRKTLVNGLASVAGSVAARAWLESARIEAGRRPQDLAWSDWVALAVASLEGNR